MKPANEMRSGMVLRLEEDLYRVIEADYHAGVGKMHGVVHAKLRNLRTGNVAERRFRQDERFEEASLERQTMEFLFEDADQCTFMHPDTYEQVSLPKQNLGPFLTFLRPNQSLQVEFFEGSPVEVIYPTLVEVRVETTPDPVHGQQDSNVFKKATLENGLEVLVPQFIKSGDLVKVDVESQKYMGRVK
jgi:elongation factor P